MTNLRMALIGCGGMGIRHLHGLAELDAACRIDPSVSGVDLVAVVDISRERAAACADQAEQILGSRPEVFADMDTLLASEVVEAVDICTMTDHHFEIAAQAAACGMHLLIEKPVSISLAEAGRLAELARSAGVVLAVAENVRREPVNRLALAVIEAGILGEIRYVEDVLFTGAADIQLTPWRHQRSSGGLLLDIGVHHADVLTYLCGPVARITGFLRLDETVRRAPSHSRVASAHFYESFAADLPDSVEADAEDVVTAVLEFASGATGTWINHQAAHGDSYARKVIRGSEGSMHLPRDRSGRSLSVVTTQGPIDENQILKLLPDWRLVQLEAAVWGDDRQPRSTGGFEEIDRKLVAIEIGDFAMAITEGRDPEIGPDEAIRAMAVVLGAAESSVEGRSLELSEVIHGGWTRYQDGAPGSRA